jgi:hypothetical protein
MPRTTGTLDDWQRTPQTAPLRGKADHIQAEQQPCAPAARAASTGKCVTFAILVCSGNGLGTRGEQDGQHTHTSLRRRTAMTGSCDGCKRVQTHETDHRPAGQWSHERRSRTRRRHPGLLKRRLRRLMERWGSHRSLGAGSAAGAGRRRSVRCWSRSQCPSTAP